MRPTSSRLRSWSFFNVGEFLEHLTSEEGREVCWSLNLTQSEQFRNEGREVDLEQLTENIMRYRLMAKSG
jgi:hypothetical protein